MECLRIGDTAIVQFLGTVGGHNIAYNVHVYYTNFKIKANIET